MACKGAKNKIITMQTEMVVEPIDQIAEQTPVRLLFGVDSKIQADDILQNNVSEFDWVTRNKLYPNFWGRNIVGENCLTKAEIDFLHSKACKIAAIYKFSEKKETEEEGKLIAKKIDVVATELSIPLGTAIFLEVAEGEYISTNFMKGYAETLISEGYTPGFKANTDAYYDFDREFSRGKQINREVFDKCVIWAVSPSLTEYDRVTTTHLIHPDNWMPYAPSGITRDDIAIWQYGKDCHPINDDSGNLTTFNVNLVKNEQIIIDKMF